MDSVPGRGANSRPCGDTGPRSRRNGPDADRASPFPASRRKLRASALRPRLAVLARALALSVLFATGCQPAMSTQPAYVAPNKTDASRPLTFAQHDFGAVAYDTFGCTVLYNGEYALRDSDDAKTPSSATLGHDYRKHIAAPWAAIRNFPGPAQVSWRSKDGSAHEALIDIPDLFEDRVIRHNVPSAELAGSGVIAEDPEILLEVNDRTVNVYMRAMVHTRELQIPGNKHSDFRNDPVLVFSHTY